MGDWGYNFQYQEYLGEVYAVAACGTRIFFFGGGGEHRGGKCVSEGAKIKKIGSKWLILTIFLFRLGESGGGGRASTGWGKCPHAPRGGTDLERGYGDVQP